VAVTDTAQQETGYLVRQLAAVGAGLLPLGKFSECDVWHDDDCGIFRRIERCTCVPDIVCRYQNDVGEIVEVMVP
jgi:hypothetical protein